MAASPVLLFEDDGREENSNGQRDEQKKREHVEKK